MEPAKRCYIGEFSVKELNINQKNTISGGGITLKRSDEIFEQYLLPIIIGCSIAIFGITCYCFSQKNQSSKDLKVRRDAINNGNILLHEDMNELLNKACTINDNYKKLFLACSSFGDLVLERAMQAREGEYQKAQDSYLMDIIKKQAKQEERIQGMEKHIKCMLERTNGLLSNIDFKLDKPSNKLKVDIPSPTVSVNNFDEESRLNGKCEQPLCCDQAKAELLPGNELALGMRPTVSMIDVKPSESATSMDPGRLLENTNDNETLNEKKDAPLLNAIRWSAYYFNYAINFGKPIMERPGSKKELPRKISPACATLSFTSYNNSSANELVEDYLERKMRTILKPALGPGYSDWTIEFHEAMDKLKTPEEKANWIRSRSKEVLAPDDYEAFLKLADTFEVILKEARGKTVEDMLN